MGAEEQRNLEGMLVFRFTGTRIPTLLDRISLLFVHTPQSEPSLHHRWIQLGEGLVSVPGLFAADEYLVLLPP